MEVAVPSESTVRPIRPAETWALRQRVLRPGQPLEACRFPGDDAPGAFHLGAFDSRGAMVAVASFNPEAAPAGLEEVVFDHGKPSGAAWRLRGMATAPEARGRGHGTALLREGMREMARRGGRMLWCNARVSAAGFYEGLGLRRAGEVFDIPGIGPHVVMGCPLGVPPDG